MSLAIDSIFYGNRKSEVCVHISASCLPLFYDEFNTDVNGPMALSSESAYQSCGCFRCLPSDPNSQFSSPHLERADALLTFRRPEEFIAPAEHPYQYIIFRASEVKDIALDDFQPPVRSRSVHDDPAVIGVSISSSFRDIVSLVMMKPLRM